LARKLSPSIIFIDEIDALLERRSSISGRSSRLEIVNEFMSQWDGLASNLNSGVVVMGATNRPFVLDDAVLRRLPRRLLIDLPDAKNRLNILINLLKENLCENELLAGLPEMAEKMNFYSGSDLKNVAITAALKSAMRLALTGNDQMIISKTDFEEAMREVPASLSDQMDSLVELRKWNQIYGETNSEGHVQRKFGFA
jgi:SpoVK/Ycf46/Vps4 family AAA+-type ATPase